MLLQEFIIVVGSDEMPAQEILVIARSESEAAEHMQQLLNTFGMKMFVLASWPVGPIASA